MCNRKNISVLQDLFWLSNVMPIYIMLELHVHIYENSCRKAFLQTHVTVILYDICKYVQSETLGNNHLYWKGGGVLLATQCICVCIHCRTKLLYLSIVVYINIHEPARDILVFINILC